MESKKISFGFNKVNKKPTLLPKKDNTMANVELIKCLEGQEIKLLEEKPEKQPIIIPLKESRKTSSALASLMKRRAVLLGEEEQQDDANAPQPLKLTSIERDENIEQRAARELLAETKRNNFVTNETNNLVLPVVKADDLPLEGAKESTLDDYESIPIQDFGKAILRGMGWTEPLPKTNKKGGIPIDDTPMVRPKGMGLGADKALKKKTLLVAPEANEVLEIKRNACVLILGGKHKNLYGKIEGFDDHAGRVIVKMAIGGSKEAFNEFLCQPVSRKEYAQYGKCINNTKYEEYKMNENKFGQIILDKKVKQERHDSVDNKYRENEIDYSINHRKDECVKDKKDIKTESGGYTEREKTGNRDKDFEHRNGYDTHCRQTSKNSYNSRRDNDNREDTRDHRRQYDERDSKLYFKNDERYRQREHKYESKLNYSHSQTVTLNVDDNCKSRDTQKHYTKCSDKSQYKTVALDQLNNSQRSSHSSKHKNTKKKSKKSKKGYWNNSSDSDTSSSSSTPDSEEEKYKKHKKKTKKSKRQRERSRSRGRR